MEPELELIIKQIKKRKPEALKKVIDLYISNVYHVAKSILFSIASEEDIEECVQDTFLDAWNNINKYDEHRGSFKTWLLILCKFKALNKKKMLLSKPEFIELKEELSSADVNPEEDYIIKEGTTEIIAAIHTLGPIDKEIFIRRYLFHQEISEICAIMKLSRQAIDNRLWRGRNQLKKILFPTGRGNLHVKE